jgi:hypothetical protein
MFKKIYIIIIAYHITIVIFAKQKMILKHIRNNHYKQHNCEYSINHKHYILYCLLNNII